MLIWELLHPNMTEAHLGYLPDFVHEDDPRPAKEQFNERYVYGGWLPFQGFTLRKDNALVYPNDPAMKPLAQCKLRNELITCHRSSWVAIIQPDRSFEVCRMD